MNHGQIQKIKNESQLLEIIKSRYRELGNFREKSVDF